jgi:hypothetical protein
VLLVVAAGAASAAIVGWLYGPIDFDLGPLHVSVTALNKPLGASLSALLLSTGLSSRTWTSARRGGEVGLYVAVWVIATVLMLGPEGQLLGTRIWYKAPSAWLLELPGFDTVRVPARWASIQILASAVLCALASAAWRERQSRTTPLVAVLALAVMLDGWYILPVAPVPTVLPLPVRADLVVELPVHSWVEDVAAMYRGITHRRPVVNGYSGYGPPHYEALSFDLQKGCLESLDAVRGGRSLDVVVHTDADDGAATVDAVRSRWPSAPEDRAGSVVVRHGAATTTRATAAHDDPIDLRDFCQAERDAAANRP